MPTRGKCKIITFNKQLEEGVEGNLFKPESNLYSLFKGNKY
jgi:hypothetical protein